MVKTSPSNAGGTVLIPGQGAKVPHPCGQKATTESNIVRNSIKTLKMVHIQKRKSFKKTKKNFNFVIKKGLCGLPWWRSG